MATAQELTTSFARLEERVGNHIKFFWGVTAFLVLCLGGLLYLTLQNKGALNAAATYQANAPALVASAILEKPLGTRVEAQRDLGAVSAILKAPQRSPQKAAPAALKPVGEKLLQAAAAYPDLPEVWQATGAFISVKSSAMAGNLSGALAAANTRQCRLILPNVDTVLFFEGCTIDLETVATEFSDNSVNGRPASLAFKDCIVVYHGGAVPSGAMLFMHSIFRFDVDIVPPRRAVQVMRDIAQADDLKSVRIPS